MTLVPPPALSIDRAAAALRSGNLTCVDLTSHALATATATDDHGVFLDIYHPQALEAALVADGELRSGNDRGPLHGIPLAVKDLIATDEGSTTAQSLVHDPESVKGDGPVVARLRAAGMVVVGKTTTMEFGVGRPDPDKPFPLPRNPWNPDFYPGGSSSGSASAVATGTVLAALGTDTGGSVRIPAAFCGVTGLKPTFGRVPKSAVVPYVYSLDHVGVLARTAHDCSLLLGVIASYDPDDLTSVDRPVIDYGRALSGDLTGVRIGVDRLSRHASTIDPSVPKSFDAALAVLIDLGAQLVDVEIPYYEEAIEVYMVTALGESLAYHGPDLRTRWDDYFAGTRTTLAGGTLYSAADYVQAQRVRSVVQRAANELFTDVDLIVTPTTSIAAPTIEALDEFFTLEAQRSVHTLYWNVVGNPALAVPIGFNAEGLPLSLQVVGRAFDEAAVLRAGDAYQNLTDWHTRRPPVDVR